MYAFSAEPRPAQIGGGWQLTTTHVESGQKWEHRHAASLDLSHVTTWAARCTDHVAEHPDWQPNALEWEFKGKG